MTPGVKLNPRRHTSILWVLKETAMTILLPLLLSLASQDDPAQEVEKLKLRIRELEKENERLKADLEIFRQQLIESAREIFDLRQQLKSVGRQDGGTKSSDTGSKTGDTKKPSQTNSGDVDVGPDKPVQGRVMYVDKDEGFLLLNIGKKEGVQVGWKFEITREAKKEKNLVMERVAVAEVIKLVGAEESHAKLKVIEGELSKVQLEDDAIAFRRTKPTKTTQETGDKKKVFKVSGQTNDVFLLSYGGIDGASPATIVYAYRGRTLVAKLRIDTVEKDFSIARVVEGTQRADVREGDLIELQEIRILVVGRVRHVGRQNGIYVDSGSDAGAKTGMRMKVTRQGRTIGEIALDQIEKLWSTAKLVGETKLEDLKKDDFVEEIP